MVALCITTALAASACGSASDSTASPKVDGSQTAATLQDLELVESTLESNGSDVVLGRTGSDSSRTSDRPATPNSADANLAPITTVAGIATVQSITNQIDRIISTDYVDGSKGIEEFFGELPKGDYAADDAQISSLAAWLIKDLSFRTTNNYDINKTATYSPDLSLAETFDRIYDSSFAGYERTWARGTDTPLGPEIRFEGQASYIDFKLEEVDDKTVVNLFWSTDVQSKTELDTFLNDYSGWVADLPRFGQEPINAVWVGGPAKVDANPDEGLFSVSFGPISDFSKTASDHFARVEQGEFEGWKIEQEFLGTKLTKGSLTYYLDLSSSFYFYHLPESTSD